MRSLRRVRASVFAILTDQASEPLLRPYATACGFDTFVGSEENVLERYVEASARYDVTIVVRATGDNPLVSWQLANAALRERAMRGADYFAFDDLPLGTGVEIVTAEALQRAYASSTDPYDLEHVTPYVYRNPDLFRAIRVVAPDAYTAPDVRVTLDTEDDYRSLTSIFDDLYDGAPIPITRIVGPCTRSPVRTSSPEAT
jgi:spore coat polysaccharide biosynthesis protein SpsF